MSGPSFAAEREKLPSSGMPRAVNDEALCPLCGLQADIDFSDGWLAVRCDSHGPFPFDVATWVISDREYMDEHGVE